jgi:hypothetical protein
MDPIEIDDMVIDTLTVQFWRDAPGPLYKGTKPPDWCAQVGKDIVVGVGGFGPTPLAALRDLCNHIARDEGWRTDNGKLLLR